MRKDAVRLEDESDSAALGRLKDVLVDPDDVRAADRKKPGLGPLEPREKPRERGLPGAAAADDGRDGL